MRRTTTKVGRPSFFIIRRPRLIHTILTRTRSHTMFLHLGTTKHRKCTTSPQHVIRRQRRVVPNYHGFIRRKVTSGFILPTIFRMMGKQALLRNMRLTPNNERNTKLNFRFLRVVRNFLVGRGLIHRNLLLNIRGFHQILNLNIRGVYHFPTNRTRTLRLRTIGRLRTIQQLVVPVTQLKCVKLRNTMLLIILRGPKNCSRILYRFTSLMLTVRISTSVSSAEVHCQTSFSYQGVNVSLSVTLSLAINRKFVVTNKGPFPGSSVGVRRVGVTRSVSHHSFLGNVNITTTTTTTAAINVPVTTTRNVCAPNACTTARGNVGAIGIAVAFSTGTVASIIISYSNRAPNCNLRTTRILGSHLVTTRDTRVSIISNSAVASGTIVGTTSGYVGRTGNRVPIRIVSTTSTGRRGPS